MSTTLVRRPFESKRDQAEWQIIYEYAITLPRNAIITYKDFKEFLGIDLKRSRTSIDRAKRELEQHHQRSLKNVRGIGYKITIGADHLDMTKTHFKKSRRQIKKSKSVIKSIDRASLTFDQKVLADKYDFHITLVDHMNHQLGSKVGIKKLVPTVRNPRQRQICIAPPTKSLSQEKIRKNFEKFK